MSAPPTVNAAEASVAATATPPAATPATGTLASTPPGATSSMARPASVAPTLSQLSGRGALVNLAFAMVTQSLALVQGIVIPRLLGPGNMGLFALALGGVGIGKALKELGIPKKLVQEREVDLYTSYRVAFTLEVLLAATFLVIVLGVAPVLAAIYHRPELWLLTSVMAFSIFTTAFLDLPAALPYREMRFVRRNVVQALGPVATFVVTVPLAFLGLGVWALAIGSLAGFAVAAVAVLFLGPIRPGWAWEGALVRRYVSYGWPLWAATVVTLAADWGVVFVVSSTIGVVGLGFFELAEGWASRALTVDTLLSDAVFPALCAIQGSPQRLRRAFDITNQLSMLFAATVGFGMAVFAKPVVLLLLGPSWRPAVLLIQAQGLGIVLASIGFNWDTFLAARGQTRPQLTVTLLAAGWVAFIALPLIGWFGIPGAAAALAFLAFTAHLVRQHYLRKLFGPISLIAVVWKQIAGSGVAAAIVVALEWAAWGVQGFWGLVAHGVVFLGLCGVSALVTTREPLLRVLDAVPRRRSRGADVDVAVERVADAGAGADAGGGPDRDSTHRYATHRPLAFPLAVRSDGGDQLWVTTRDWPALGRMDLLTGDWRWTEMAPFPHLATPDGDGGCWTALTRSSRVVHVDGAGVVDRVVELPKTRELLGSVLAAGSLWVVDGWRRVLWRIPLDEGGSVVEVPLPAVMRRPDLVAEHLDGTLWVGDTRVAVAAVVDPVTGAVRSVELPHPTRWLLPDPVSGGLWLGASGRSRLTLVDGEGRVRRSIDPGGVPFDLARSNDGSVLACLKDAGSIAVVPAAEGAVDHVSLGPGSEPMGLTVVGDRCFVTLAATSEIVSIPLPAAAVALPPSGFDPPVPA